MKKNYSISQHASIMQCYQLLALDLPNKSEYTLIIYTTTKNSGNRVNGNIFFPGKLTTN